MNKKLDILSSFLAGFGERSDSDVMNGLFITVKKLGMKISFDFESRSCLGVESKELRRILNFSRPLKIVNNHEKFFKAGQFLSKMGSDEMGWAAQYLMNGKTHLYPSEAKKAIEIGKSFPLLSP